MTPAESLARIAAALGGTGRPSPSGWYTCHCPIHSDRHPSLSVAVGRSGRLVVHCFAGCKPALIVDYLRTSGLWFDEKVDADTIARIRANSEEHRLDRFLEARRIWRETVPLEGTPGDHYLRHWRAISGPIGPRLRWHWGRFALVALITDPITDCATGVQVTPVDRLTHRREGGISCTIGDKKRPKSWRLTRRRDPGSRRFIGATGVVRLLDGPGELVIGEGLETTLSGAAIVGAGSALSALSASSLRHLRLPSGLQKIGLLVDRDDAGEAACQNAAARLAAVDPSRRIRLLRPRPPYKDFNDVARAAAERGHRE